MLHFHPLIKQPSFHAPTRLQHLLQQPSQKDAKTKKPQEDDGKIAFFHYFSDNFFTYTSLFTMDVLFPVGKDSFFGEETPDLATSHLKVNI